MAMPLKLKNPDLLREAGLIDGRWRKAEGENSFPVYNPATGDKLANVTLCGAEEAKAAIKAAEKALDGWKVLTSKERSALLMAWHDEIMSNLDDLALILTAEMGKPLTEARGEVAYGATYIKWFAEEAKRIYGDTISSPLPNKRVVVIKQPIGVVACITPWNFPSAMLARKLGPALAAGNTVICKPANETPLSAFALGQLAIDAGIPAGVINIVCGDTAKIGDEITSNPIVRKLSFTGSTPIGKLLAKQCAATMKRTSMELGGNAPFIVFDDADISEAVAGLMATKFRNAGQTCVCADRIFLQSGIYEAFLAELQKAVSKLKLGDGLSEGVTIGPLIHPGAADDIRAIIKDAADKGAKVRAGGYDIPSLGEGFVTPTILTDVTPSMRAYKGENFGPVVSIIKFETEDEVIRMGNDTAYGLAGYFYSRDIGRIWRVSEALEYGMVGINTAIISNEMAPFGGIKESGHGREGSKYGLDDYLEIKSLTFGGLDK